MTFYYLTISEAKSGRQIYGSGYFATAEELNAEKEKLEQVYSSPAYLYKGFVVAPSRLW